MSYGALGKVPEEVKQYSPVERKYATATSGRLNPIGLDPLINLFFGEVCPAKKRA